MRHRGSRSAYRRPVSDIYLLAAGAVAGFLAHAFLGRRNRQREAARREVLEREVERLRGLRGHETSRIAALEKAAAEPDPRIEAETAELRRRMDELADALMKAAPRA